MSKRLKIAQIAIQTGLSVSTVSRVLAGKANTSDTARQKVIACATQLGVLKGMADGRLLLNSLAIFAPRRAFEEQGDIFYYRVIQSIKQALSPHEVRLRCLALEEHDSNANLFLAIMNEPHTEAAILVGIDDPHIHDLAADLAKPCVLINCRDRKMRLPAVSPAHRLQGEYAARYLFEMGHKRVVNLLCLRRYTMEQRLAGIRDAWEAANIPFVEADHLIQARCFSAIESEMLMCDFLENTPPARLPDAVLVGGDFMASGVVAALHKFGLRVPSDMSVLSIDGFNLETVHDIPLTALRVPRDELGIEAVHMLKQRLIRPDAATGTLLLNGSLVMRESVRRVRSGRSRVPVKKEKLYG